MTAYSFIFAGGGSGGHISPGLAVAERLAKLDPRTRVHFVCSDRAIDRTMLEHAGAAYTAVPAAPPAVRPRAGWQFARGFLRSRGIVRRLLRDHAVDRVLALGGFVSVPAVAAARAHGVPITLLNLDAPPGRANRLVAPRCDEVLSAVATPLADLVVGLPVREAALAPADQAACRERLGLDPMRPTLLVTGASQGAGSINAVMIELATHHAGVLDKWQVIHLTGELDEHRIAQAYTAAGWRHSVRTFLHEMGVAWGAADLAISRAGANSIAEIAANEVPAILLPYPYHSDDHQHRNAQPLVDAGGAVIVPDAVDPTRNAERLLPALHELTSEERRHACRSALRDLGSGDAAGTVALRLLDRPESVSSDASACFAATHNRG